jgi:hypothetical protein
LTQKTVQLVEKGVKVRSIVSARKNLSVKKEVKIDQAHPLKCFSTEAIEFVKPSKSPVGLEGTQRPSPAASTETALCSLTRSG